MAELYIIGAGGHGVVVAEIAIAAGWDIIGFVDDDPSRGGQGVLDWAILGGRDVIPDNSTVALGVGDNRVRFKLLDLAEARDWVLPVLVHPSAVVSPSACLDHGTVVMPQVVVNARAGIGSACILNTACSVDHDCLIESCVHIAPGVRLGGTVRIGARSLVGIGSCAKQGISVGADCTIGAGSVLINPIPDGVTAWGCPAIALDVPSAG